MPLWFWEELVQPLIVVLDLYRLGVNELISKERPVRDEDGLGHRWNDGPLGSSCMNCGCYHLNAFHEPSDASRCPCVENNGWRAALDKLFESRD